MPVRLRTGIKQVNKELRCNFWRFFRMLDLDDPGSDPATTGEQYSGIIRPQGPEVNLPTLAFLASMVPEKMGWVRNRMILDSIQRFEDIYIKIAFGWRCK
jgi:hypothetical protein